jgi:broad specificity phosphatase PhoE
MKLCSYRTSSSSSFNFTYVITISISIFITIFLMTVTQQNSMTAEALSADAAPKVKVKPVTAWQDYKKDLIKAGVLEAAANRDIKIRAMNLNSNANANSDGNENENDIESEEGLIASKIIHFQRHGQGYHNLLGDTFRALGQGFDIDDPDPAVNPFVKPEIQDSPLTQKGREEARAQRPKAAMLQPEVVIVSPLHRAIQTAQISFADHLENDIDFIAHEGCREQLGLLTCNKAHPLSSTKSDFPSVDFSLCTFGEEDTLWNAHPAVRELPVDESDRAYAFLTDFIMERPEKEIAVVCHSAWLFSVCNVVIDCEGDEFLETWFGTGEIRSLKLSYYKNQ